MRPRTSLLSTVVLLMPLALGHSVGLDIFIPAIPKLMRELHSNREQAQLLLGVFLITTAWVQLILGPISDHVGRRVIALISAVLYAVSSYLCAIALTIDQLMIARIFQAIGAGGTFMIAFAIIRDRFAHERATRAYSSLNGAMVIAPMLAPAIGGLLDIEFGWRAAFYFLSGFGVLTVSVIIFFLPETLSARKQQPFSLSVFSRYWQMLRTRQFLWYCLATSFSVGHLFLLFSLSPYLLEVQLHYSELAYSFFFIFTAICVAATAIATPRLTAYLSHYTTTLCGIVISMLGSLLALWLHLHLCLMLLLISVGATMVMGAATAAAMEPFSNHSGSAAAMIAMMQYTIAFSMATLVAHWQIPLATALSLAVLGCGLLLMVIFLLQRTSLIIDNEPLSI